MAAWALSLLLPLLLVVVTAADTDTVCDDPLSCYLQNLQIVVPDYCTAVAGTDFCLTNGLLHDFDLIGFPTSYIYPTTIYGELNDFSTVFTSNYKYGYLKGVLVASVTDVDIDMDTDFPKGVDSIYPIGTNITSCNVNNLQVSITVSSLLVPSIVEDAVSSFITKMIEDLFCVKVVNAVDTNVTSFIVNQITPELIRIVELVNDTTSVPTMYTSSDEYVNWKETPLEAIGALKQNELIRHFLGCLLNLTDIYTVFTGPMFNYLIDYVTHGTGVVTVSLPTLGGLDLGLVNVSINGVSIGGLDTFSNFNIIEPDESKDDANITLSTRIYLDKLTIVVNTSITSHFDPTYSEVYLFSVHVSDASLDIDVAVAVNKAKLSQLYVDQVADAPCLLSTVDYLNATSLGVHLNITSMVITDSDGDTAGISDDLVKLFNSIFSLVDVGYNDLLAAVIAGAAQGPLRAAINDVLSIAVAASGSNCTSHIEYDITSDDAIVKWSDSEMVVAAAYVIDSVLGADGINNLMTCATNGTGVVNVPITNYWQVNIGGLDTFYNLSLLSLFESGTPEQYDIGSVVGMGSCGSTTCDSFYVEAVKEIEHESNPKFSLPSASTFLLSFERLFIDALTLIKFNMNKFKNLQVQDVVTKGCVIGSIDTAELQRLVLSSATATFAYDKKEVSITSILQVVFDHMSMHLDSINARVDGKLSEMDTICANGGVVPSSGGGTGTHTTWLSARWGVALLTLSALAALGVAVMMRRRHYLKAKGAYDSGDSIIRPSFIPPVWSYGFWRRNVVEKYRWRDSLVFDANIALSLRLALLLAAAGDLALFLVSNLAADAVAVKLFVNSGTPQEVSATIFTFGLSQTVDDMWQSKSYILAFLIAFLSGFWPYAKLFMMVGCLVLPRDIISVATREEVLRFLDFYGKWSLLDIFVMVMMMCAFHLELPISSEPYLVVSVLVTPHYGFYVFLYATMLSLTLGHVVLCAHRSVEERKALTNTEIYEHIVTTDSPLVNSTKQLGTINSFVDEERNTFPSGLDKLLQSDVCAMAGYTFSCPSHFVPGYASKGAAVGVSITPRGKAVILLLLLTTIVLLVPALVVNTFEFEIKGLTALFIDGSATTPYSFYSVGVLVPEASGATGFNIKFVQFAYFLFGLVFPYVLVAVIFTALFVPMSLRHHKRLLVYLEVAAAWSALDCFLLSIVASLMQIQQFAAFIVGDTCDGINAIIATYLNSAVDGDDKCFDVVARLLPASAYLFIAVLLLTFMAVMCLRLLDAYIEGRIEASSAQSVNLHTPLLGGKDAPAAVDVGGVSSLTCGSILGYLRTALRLLYAAPIYLIIQGALLAGMVRVVSAHEGEGTSRALDRPTVTTTVV